MQLFAALFHRRPRPEAPDQSAAIRLLQAEHRRDREHIMRLESMLRVEAGRTQNAEQALTDFRQGICDGHAQVVADNARLRRENELLRRDREGALRQLNNALGYDDKVLATINAGGISKAAA
ncbi:hypothetical protein [Kitasatospora sp. NPDC051164]|uniref:hypothetical protein n=1 Tax=Kitasatospora sp. NPDC051164 TaxID=3364055 RepID=UPI0037977DD7